MTNRYRVHITATVHPEAAEYIEHVAEKLGINKSRALEMIVLKAKEAGLF
jgi:hypothetical protein